MSIYSGTGINFYFLKARKAAIGFLFRASLIYLSPGFVVELEIKFKTPPCKL
jgi:hypothetical protein